tara:strand:+ start:2188 stop:2421 length:234 start_codon:yes stop_codon:yes gene_type:complete
MKNTEIKLILQKILLRNEQRKVNNLIPSDILDIKDIIKQLTLPIVVKSFYCGALVASKDQCETQCLGCAGFDRICNE